MSIFKKRIQEIREHGEEYSGGGNLSVWMSDELISQVTTLATQLGISRSAAAREVLEIAVPEALEEALQADQLEFQGIDLDTALARVTEAPEAPRVLKPGGLPVSPYQSNIRTAVHPGRAVRAAGKRKPAKAGKRRGK